MGTPSSQPNPYREATKFPEIEGSWGGEGLLLELLEGTDSEAAVAHVGVRGTLSLRLGGPRTAGDERIYLGPRSLLLGPFPGPSCPHPHSGHPSSCTKVAVVPVLPTPGARVGSLLPVLPPASAPILDNLVHSYSWIAQLCVCVNPFPMPCMTCDAADTTILCAGVLGGTEGHVPVLLHPPPCDPCTRL